MRLSKLVLILPILGLQGCFTGIESTPRISYSDVEKAHITVTPEQKFLSDIAYTPPGNWKSGKRFYITDKKISYVLSADTPIDTTCLAGHDLIFSAIQPNKSVVGNDLAVISFIGPSGETLNYRSDIPFEEILIKEVEVPFTIDLDVVDSVKHRLAGNTYYIVTPMWYDAEGVNKVTGLRHVPVTVTDVVPGNSVYPLRVVFKTGDSDKHYSIYMTIGDRRSATQNFDRILAFNNPREKYPQITDEIWDLIIHSQVKSGMSKDECRLALGPPNVSGQRPTTAGMVEYWSYSDGIYLLFEEGYLTTYRR